MNPIVHSLIFIKNPEVLIPKAGSIKKLTTYAPIADAENIKLALFKAGAGTLGKYSNCSYSLDGIGSFKAENGANPAVGKVGEIHCEKETQINVVFSFEKEKNELENRLAEILDMIKGKD